ncbi:replication-associated recombination protein A [Rhodopirellula sp. MGV]|uniref:replication-associated recombination protein A n=1 Tax=Rhodopirellula sp. MGV TaxID=2023130 RepID=UPI000B9678AC|nr:replication-associated recombination protein A [Rhodopirellula sp. MGV]OYP34982.1 AAA family ATPase [Rhodopirellula sp. MGV]PNY38122.1 replication-associated recombination protein A [Rhodopirellula baltica]
MSNTPSLFDAEESNHFDAAKPLAARMRPTTLAEYVGQHHILGPGKLLRRMVDAGKLGSIILSGPPGTGKTTLANLLASETGSRFRTLSAVTGGVKDVREAMAWAKDLVATGEPAPVLFIDEIHRFSKSQQDALLPDVEEGIVSLIGATTSNPYFAVNGALISRSHVFQLQMLSADEIATLIRRALNDATRGLGKLGVKIDDEAIALLASVCEGDARRALTSLEIAVASSDTKPPSVTTETAAESIGKRVAGYDGTGDDHYDLISAMIKSIRGSDPDAALYWLARMLEGGEDIRFLCRRLVILASEDIGNADPHALPLAVACMQGCEFVGLPESQLLLSQTASYLALAPKSNASTVAISQARRDVREKKLLAVPQHLMDGHSTSAATQGRGEGYIYSHDCPDGIAAQDYLGSSRTYYEPVERGFERDLQKRKEWVRRRLKGEA